MARDLLLLAAALFHFSALATIHRVNNTGIAADFTTLQAAHDAASTGDTLHLEPSGSSYGDCSFTKPLVVIGPGWLLTANMGLQANPSSAITGGLLFEAGSEGTVVSGLDVQGQSRVKASYVRLERCRFTAAGMDLHIVYNDPGLNISGVVVNGCNVLNNLIVGATGSTINALVISNTRVRQFNFSTGGTTAGEVINCVAIGQGTAAFGGSGMVFRNCIFDGAVVPGTSAYEHNIFSGAPVPATNGNQINVDMNTVFVGGTGDAQYQLAVGSPAIGAGVGSTDCGLFGGLEPYRLSGIPPVPSIFTLSAATVTDQGTPLQVTISGRSND